MLVKKQSAAIAVTAIRARRGTPEAERRTKKRGGLTLRCENIEHARCGIQPGIARGQNGCEHDGVHDGGSGQEARALKHKRKGTHADVGKLVFKQPRVRIRDDEADHQNGEDIKKEMRQKIWCAALGMFLPGFSLSPAAIPMSSVP